MEPIIRKETPHDYRAVETMTRNAFYNIYVPGCIEHYLVHTMRSHEDFIPELDFVLELDGQVIGNMQNMLYDSAAFILFIIPLIVLYLFTQKGFVQSIERSGLVG